MRKSVFVAIGNSCLDSYYRISQEIKTGNKVSAEFMEKKVGGMIGNAASVYAGYGEDVYMIDFLSDSPDSQLLIGDMEKYHINTSAIQVDDKYVNSECVIMLSPSGERTILVIDAANDPYILNEAQTVALQQANFVYTTIRDIKKIQNYRAVLELVTKNQAKLVFDLEALMLHDREADLELLSWARIIFMNEEARLWLDEHYKPAFFATLQDKVAVIVVTKAEKGCEIHYQKELISAPAFRVPVVDTTGAGDTFNATFLLGMSKNWELVECARFAAFAASEKIKRLGPRSGVRRFDELYQLYSLAKS